MSWFSGHGCWPERRHRLPGNRDNSRDHRSKGERYLSLEMVQYFSTGAAVFRQVTLRAKGLTLHRASLEKLYLSIGGCGKAKVRWVRRVAYLLFGRDTTTGDCREFLLSGLFTCQMPCINCGIFFRDIFRESDRCFRSSIFGVLNEISNAFKTLLSALVALAAMYMGSSLAPAQNKSNPAAEAKSKACPNDDSGLQLPTAFAQRSSLTTLVTPPHGSCAKRVLTSTTWVGQVLRQRHAACRRFPRSPARQKRYGKGRCDERFGETVQSGGAGGTGIDMYKGSIYARSMDRIVRYLLPGGSIVPSGSADTIVSGCLWAATSKCIHSSSMPKAQCTSMSPARPIPAN